jgi:hypothetical protein
MLNAGYVHSYIIFQGTLWWILNICAIFWKVQFPFHSRYFDKTNQTKYVHAACVAAAVIIPIFAPLAMSLRGGFTFVRFPPVTCLGRDVDVAFYAVVLPATMLYATGTTLLLLILWRIRMHMTNSIHSTRKTVLFSPAERKIFVVFLYYLFSGVLQLTIFSITTANLSKTIDDFNAYFNCQRSGEDSLCSLDTKQAPFWSLFAFIVLFLFPAINLYFAMKIGDFKLVYDLCGRIGRKLTQHYQKSV